MTSLQKEIVRACYAQVFYANDAAAEARKFHASVIHPTPPIQP